MIAVTNLELSKQLFEAFPEWHDTEYAYFNNHGTSWSALHIGYAIKLGADYATIKFSAYHLAYLLDKLPEPFSLIYRDGGWECGTSNPADISPKYNQHWQLADNPTDAAGLLCLKLKKEGLM